MKIKRILQYLGIMLFGVLAFFIGFYCGTDDYKSDLIAVKHIDGKYGKAFYGVEVWGKDIGNRIEIYARIYVDGISSFSQRYLSHCNLSTSKSIVLDAFE